MAQTKTKQKSKSSSSKSKPRKAKSKTSNSSKSKAASAKQKVASNGAAGANGAGGVAGKALMAGGAALIGAAGGLAYGAAHSGSKVMGIRMPGSKRVSFKSRDVRRAAKDVGHLGDQVGQFTKELHKARDDSDGSIGAPVEMLVRTFARRR